MFAVYSQDLHEVYFPGVTIINSIFQCNYFGVQSVQRRLLLPWTTIMLQNVLSNKSDLNNTNDPRGLGGMQVSIENSDAFLMYVVMYV